MGNIVELNCGKLCNINLKDPALNTKKYTIISNSNEYTEQRNNKYHETQCSNSMSNYNSSIIQNNENTEINEKDAKNMSNTNKQKSQFSKSKFNKTKTENPEFQNNNEVRIIKSGFEHSQTEFKGFRANSYIANDIIKSKEETNKSIHKIEKAFHLNLLESLKEIKENEKELNNRLDTVKFHTNMNLLEYRNENTNETIITNNEDEINAKEEEQFPFRQMTVKNPKSFQFKSTEEIMFAGLDLKEETEIKGYFQLKKNCNFKYYGKKEIDKTKNGFGIIKWDDGSILSTVFSNSKINGYAIFKNNQYTEPAIYYGNYIDNIPKGFGYYICGSIKTISDSWFKNKINGLGIRINIEDETIYKGEFLESKKNGLGVFIYKDGTTSYGEWIDDKLNGYGIIKYSNESIYAGQFKDNIFHGFGEFLWYDGKYYIGEYNMGIKDGFGIFVWNFDKSDAYIGFWENGKTSGIGIKLDDSNYKLCYWKEGRKITIIKNWELDDYLKKYDNKYKKIFEKKHKSLVKFIHKLKNGDIFKEKFYSII